MVKFRVIAFVGVCLLMVGCSGGEAPQGASPSPTLTPTAITATAIWPNLRVQRVSSAINDNVQMLFQGGGTPDGHYLLVKLTNRYDPGYGTPYPEHIALYTVATGALRIIASASDAKHGLSGFTADNHWVVWYERGLPEISTDPSWTLSAFNIDTGAITTVAQSSMGDGVYPQPQIDQGKLVWDEVTGAVTIDHANFVIRLLDLATGNEQTIAHKAGYPVISWPWVGWEQVTAADGTGVEQFQNMQTGEQVTLPVMAYETVLVGTSFVYQAGNNADDTGYFHYVPDIRHPQDGAQEYFPKQDTINSLTFNGRYIGWHSGADRSPPFVYDVQRRQAVELPLKYRSNGSELTSAIGRYVVWVEDPDTDTQENYSYQTLHQEPPKFYSIIDLSAVGG